MTDETPEIHITIHTPIDLSDQNELAKKLAPVLVMHLERYKALGYQEFKTEPFNASVTWVVLQKERQ